MDKSVEMVISYFKEGFACSESVLKGFADANGISSDVIPKIATGFAGGIGRRGSMCGALTGAIMGLGLIYGRNRVGDSSAYELCMAKSFECYERFRKEFEDVTCYGLIGCDLSTPEGRRNFKELGLRDKKCIRYIEEAAKILSDLIEKRDR